MYLGILHFTNLRPLRFVKFRMTCQVEVKGVKKRRAGMKPITGYKLIPARLFFTPMI